jgi:D-ribulokinase
VERLAAGIDIGTGGVRVAAYDGTGRLWAEASQPLRSVRDGARFEQDPAAWWEGAATGLRAVIAATAGRAQIVAVSVAATSGTMVLLDADGDAIRPAIMYGDGRSTAQAAQINDAATQLREQLGYTFNASWGLPKVAWLARHEPQNMARAAYIAHAGDVVTGRLSGRYDVSDTTQALKTGYDVLTERWPPLIEALGLPAGNFPQIARSGTVIGEVTTSAADATGLDPGTLVVAGMTDGCASQIASGATEPGQWLSVLGTTLVVKGVSDTLLLDPAGRVYSHRHPAGYWLPGAASNVGGGALAAWRRDDWARLNDAALGLSPTGFAVYPLTGTGERFPFVDAGARGFSEGTPRTDAERYAATLEGVAYVERLGYDVLQELGATVGERILTTGGGTAGAAWNQIRADVLGRTLEVVAEPGAAFGAALLAAGVSLYPDLGTATAHMIKPGTAVQPRPEYRDAYERGYERFRTACRERGYI